MKMDETDAFFLNGTRLILLSSTSSERQYESETGHIKVTGYFSGHVLKYFKAFFPNGSQATFGFSWNTSNQFTYPVSELTDGKGNTINYGYSFLSNVYYISSVTYGYGYSVSFEYSTDRPDALLCYHNGSELIENHRIQSVKCYSGNTLLNTYTLSYSIQNNVSVYEGVELEDDVFCGPSMVFTNDLTPRAKYPKGSANYKKTLIRHGATIGANATVVCGHTLGEWCTIAAGAVVTKNVKAHALMAGVPAKQIGWVCECGQVLKDSLACPDCDRKYTLIEDGLREV